MAGSIPPLVVEVQLQTAALQAQVAQLESKMRGIGDTVKKTEAPMNKFGATLRGLVPAVGLVGLISFGKQVLNAAEASEKADKRIDQISKSMGIFGGDIVKVTDRLKNYADAQARLTGVDDEVIKATQAKLLTFKELAVTAGTVGSAFDRTTQAAVDMAAAGFGEATSNAVQLGKALNDPIKGVTALTRSGITFTQAEKDKIAVMVNSNQMLAAQDFVLKAIEKQVGGTAAATASSSDKMRQAFGQVQESIGLALLPMLNKFSDWFVSVSPKIEKFFKDLNDPTTKAGQEWQKFTEFIKDAFKYLLKNADAIKNYAVQIAAVVIAYKTLTTAINVAKTATILYAAASALTPWGLLAIAIGSVAGFYLLLSQNADKAKNSEKRYIDQQAERFKFSPEVKAAIAKVFPKAKPLNVSDVGSSAYLSAEARARATDYSDLYVPSTPTGSGGLSAAETASKKAKAANAAVVKVINDTRKAVSAANDQYASDVKAANDKYGALIKQFSEEMTNVIKTSMNRLRDAFKNAVATDVGSIFKGLVDDGKSSADDLLAALKSKFEAAKTLAENAATLASAGYSQTFIEQVVSQGPKVGNNLAAALKSATPEAVTEIQRLFLESEKLANTGMDTLAQRMYDKSGLATAELKTLFDAAQANMVQAQQDLQTALTTAAQTLYDSLSAIETAFNTKLEAMAAAAAKHAATIAKTLATISSGKSAATTAGAKPVTPIPSAAAQAKLDKVELAKFQSQFNITNNVQTNASPSLIADTTVASIKYGIPLSKLTA